MIWVFIWEEWADEDDDEWTFLLVTVAPVELAIGMIPLDAELAFIEAMSEEVLIEFMLLALAPMAVGPDDNDEFWLIEVGIEAIVVTGRDVDVLMLFVLNELGIE